MQFRRLWISAGQVAHRRRTLGRRKGAFVGRFRRRWWTETGLIWAVLFGAGAARAGPPFITDDPEPVDLGHWEVYGFSAATQVTGDMAGTLIGTEVNYGAAPNLQLHIIVPMAFDSPSGRPMQMGIGDVELGAKYRFINPGKDDWWPEVATFPLVEVPAGDASRGLGAGKTRVYLPIWLQKNFGPWTTYGGGGYWINPGVGNKNYWFTGWLLQS